MTSASHNGRAGFAAVVLTAAALFLAGCASRTRGVPAGVRLTLDSPMVVLPARTIGSYLVLEAKWDRRGPYRFIIDTGSSVTLVSAELARRYGVPLPNENLAVVPVPVRSASGRVISLPPVTIDSIELEDALFESIPALVYDFGPLSAHLGVRIDGILGFPFFRGAVLTLDYPGARIILTEPAEASNVPGTTIAFNNNNRIPFVPVEIEGIPPMLALVDSGSDAPLRLNLAGMAPPFLTAPRSGPLVATLSGDHEPRVGRLDGIVRIAGYELLNPLAEVTDELPAIGGEILRNFTVTFDQERNRVTFHRESRAPIPFPARRSIGLSFTRAPAYWRVDGVLQESPASALRIRTGDLITRINGEPVANWNLERFDQLLATADTVTLTFLEGNTESTRTVAVFDLVP